MVSPELRTTFENLDLLEIYLDILDDMMNKASDVDEEASNAISECIGSKFSILTKQTIKGTEIAQANVLKRLAQARYRFNGYSDELNEVTVALCKRALALAKLQKKSTEEVSLGSNIC